MKKYNKFFVSDQLQFGFKQDIGCANATFALRQVVQYFNSRNSNVYIASLDASKAFDRVNHFKIFSILYNRGLPEYFIKTLVNWCSKLFVAVQWNSVLSGLFKVNNGVR